MNVGEINPIIPEPVRYVADKARRIATKIVAEPGFVPQYKTAGAACCDLMAFLPEGNVTLAPAGTVKIDTGISIHMPAGYEALIRARSGLSSEGIICANASDDAGTIDEDYRGRIKVILTNVGEFPVFISHGQRIAQMCIKPVWHFDFEPVEKLEQTGRGGFGSTGAT